ncbi:hypothetical protein [Streptacidiphilus rugosus]|uniref:hypothetical protein n=1 Tax=Streptacidiphilus rugosus TaxID=405783 RepID=UPI0012FCBC10|nr:hypothetical protein [Streptacidiphilus rugosus]
MLPTNAREAGCALVVQVVERSGETAQAVVTSGSGKESASVPAGLPAHARSRPLHWLGTAAGVAAVVGTVLVVGPAGASQQAASGSAHPLGASAAPDPAKATLPLDCAGQPVRIDQHFGATLPGSGTPVTVVAARCDAGGGTPPDGLFVLKAGAAQAVSLLDPAKGLTVASMAMRSDGSIHAVVSGYSSNAVPNCCPDVHETLDWSFGADGSWGAAVVTANQSQV